MNLPGIFNNSILSVGLIVLGLNIGIIFFMYFFLNKRLKAAEAERDAYRKVSPDGPGSPDTARKQAMLIIQRAQEKAQQILTETKQFQLDAKRILETELKEVTNNESQELQKTSSELIKNYEDSLSKVKNDDINMFKTMTDTIQKDIEKEMQDFKATLEKQTLSSQKTIEQKLQQQYAQVGVEIETYRKERVQQVDTHILQLLDKVTLLALGKSLSMQDHQDLVLEALEEAKKSVPV